MSMITIKKCEPERRQIGELSHLDFGKPEGELGCFLNYEPRELEPPTEKQIGCLEYDGVVIPNGATKQDASAMISRCESWDVQPLPDPDRVDLALSFGCEFSAFVGADDLLDAIIYRANKDERAALYCYGVACSMSGRVFGNMLTDPDAPIFISFADVVAADPSLQKSLADRWPDDFRKPNKSTKIYKAAAAHLAGGGA